MSSCDKQRITKNCQSISRTIDCNPEDRVSIFLTLQLYQVDCPKDIILRLRFRWSLGHGLNDNGFLGFEGRNDIGQDFWSM